MCTTNTNPAGGAGRMDKSRKLLILGAVIVILVAIVWYFGSRPNTANAPGGIGSNGSATEPAQPAAGLGSSLYRAPANPAAKLPDVNPLQNNANPYKGAYTNPF